MILGMKKRLVCLLSASIFVLFSHSSMLNAAEYSASFKNADIN